MFVYFMWSDNLIDDLNSEQNFVIFPNTDVIVRDESLPQNPLNDIHRHYWRQVVLIRPLPFQLRIYNYKHPTSLRIKYFPQSNKNASAINCLYWNVSINIYISKQIKKKTTTTTTSKKCSEPICILLFLLFIRHKSAHVSDHFIVYTQTQIYAATHIK